MLNTNNYKIIKLIGSGSFSFVYKVRDINKNKIFALKSYINNNYNNLNAKREIKIIKKLDGFKNNKYILNYDSYFYDTNTNNYNIVMDYFEKDLFEIVNNSGIYDIKFDKIISNLNDSIQYMHKNNIILDIKLENIMYCKSNDRYKIFDFNLSQILVIK